MTAERWKLIDDIFQAALEREPPERAAFLNEACAGDAALREEVESLISSDEEQNHLIDSPAFEVGAILLASPQKELPSGFEIGPYKILSLLGRGGMGEVYLAEDRRLGRKVALKLLPSDFTKAEERVRRFRQEARAASALNHPNIITIYEIGQFNQQYFIATEFIEGETLRHRLKHKKLGLYDALDVSVQAASALAAAHSAGIVHRDIKPENIMLRPDGYVKVLDFGLAKLTEQQFLAVEGEGPTAEIVDTAPGMLMGTVNYMSPEQARGVAIDARSDIFSLGIAIYEMMTGRSPFEGNTPSDLIAAILKVDPPPLRDYLPNAPDGLQQIIDRALCKHKEERYQSVANMLADLKTLKREQELGERLERAPQTGASTGAGDTASGSQMAIGTSGERAGTTADAATGRTLSSAEIILSEIKRHKAGAAVTLIIILIAVAAAGYLVNRFIAQSRSASSKNIKLSRITTSGKAGEAAISPDGKYVAYVSQETGQPSLWIRQVITNSNVQIIPPGQGSYRSLTFSPDGNYLYCYGQSKDDVEPAIYQIPALGGVAKKLIADVSNSNGMNRISLSPDGQRLVFTREYASGETAVVVANTDGSGEQKIATRQANDHAFFGSTAWSPDGKKIACVGAKSDGQRLSADIIEVALESGVQRPPIAQRWAWINDVAWLSDGSGLLMTAADQEGSTIQIWRLSYPDGNVRRITTDLNAYTGLSLSADSTALVTTQSQGVLNLWVQPDGDTSRAQQITSGSATKDGADGIGWTLDGKIVYSSHANGDPDIWIVDPDGSNKRQLTAGLGSDSYGLSVSPDGRYVFFTSNRGGIWRVDINGGNPRQLTGEGHLSTCCPDGKWVFYVTSGSNRELWWKVPIGGGEAVQLTGPYSDMVLNGISPDGKLIAVIPPESKDGGKKLAIVSSEGREPIKILDFPVPVRWRIQWTADSRAITYIVKGNLWSQAIDGGPPKQLTNFKEAYGIQSFAWSPDGKQLACARGHITTDVVLLSNFR
jgi:serine/threonine protein kinase